MFYTWQARVAELFGRVMQSADLANTYARLVLGDTSDKANLVAEALRRTGSQQGFLAHLNGRCYNPEALAKGNFHEKIKAANIKQRADSITEAAAMSLLDWIEGHEDLYQAAVQACLEVLAPQHGNLSPDGRLPIQLRSDRVVLMPSSGHSPFKEHKEALLVPFTAITPPVTDDRILAVLYGGWMNPNEIPNDGDPIELRDIGGHPKTVDYKADVIELAEEDLSVVFDGQLRTLLEKVGCTNKKTQGESYTDQDLFLAWLFARESNTFETLRMLGDRQHFRLDTKNDVRRAWETAKKWAEEKPSGRIRYEETSTPPKALGSAHGGNKSAPEEMWDAHPMVKMEEVVQCALGEGLVGTEKRRMLLNGLPMGFVYSLPTVSRPIDQLRFDLMELERTPNLIGLEYPPISIWLRNAAQIAYGNGHYSAAKRFAVTAIYYAGQEFQKEFNFR